MTDATYDEEKIEERIARDLRQKKFSTEIGNRIRQVREKRKIPKLRLADQLGMTRQTLGNIEKGRYAIKVANLYDLSLAFDVEPRIWFYSEEKWDSYIFNFDKANGSHHKTEEQGNGT